MLRVFAVGRMKDKRLASLAEDYLLRIRSLAPVALTELKDRGPEREADDMLARLGSPDGSQWIVALDERGEEVTSEQLSRLLAARGGISFLLGGADGLGAAARQRADQTLRLSSLTLTHEMARVLLLEQIYRGLTIVRGMPYHRA